MPLPLPDHTPAAIARLRSFALDLARVHCQPVLLVLGQDPQRNWQWYAGYLKLLSEASQHERERAYDMIYPPEKAGSSCDDEAAQNSSVT